MHSSRSAFLLLLALSLATHRVTFLAQDTPPSPSPPDNLEAPAAPVAPAAPAAPEPAAAPEPPSATGSTLLDNLTKKSRESNDDPEIFRIGQPVHVSAGESIRSAVVVQSSATIDGRVEQDLVVVGGKARINGTVGGDVVNVGGGIILGPEARIRGNAIGVVGGIRMGTNSKIGGDAFGIGGGVRRAEGAVVRGETIDQHIALPFGDWMGPDGIEFPEWIGATFQQIVLKCRPLSFRVSWVWLIAGLFLALHLLLTLAAPGMVLSISSTLSERGATAFLMGFLALPLGALITLILASTVIGLLVVPFVGATFLLAAVAGKAGLLHFLGTSIVRLPNRNLSPIPAVALGTAIVTALYLIPFLGMVSWAVLSMWAIGAGLLALFSRFRKEARPATTPSTSSQVPVQPSAASAPTPAPILKAMTPTPTTLSSIASTRVNLLANPLTGSTAPTSLASVATPDAPDPITSGPQRSNESSPIPEPVASTPPPVTASHTALVPDVLTLPRVALKERLLASLIDGLLLLLLFRVMDLGGTRWQILISIGYFAGFWIWRQTTLGGTVLQLKVVRLDGRPIDPATAFVRSLSALFGILALGLGYVWSAWDQEKQGWHDKIAGTVVVRLPKTQPLV